jgi:hypothetical protein
MGLSTVALVKQTARSLALCYIAKMKMLVMFKGLWKANGDRGTLNLNRGAGAETEESPSGYRSWGEGRDAGGLMSLLYSSRRSSRLARERVKLACGAADGKARASMGQSAGSVDCVLYVRSRAVWGGQQRVAGGGRK